MTERATIRFEPGDRSVTVPVGSTLLEAARAAGVEIDAPCGGTGRCGSCRVRASGSLAPLSGDERELLGGAGVAMGKRLACRARVTGDATVLLDEAPRKARVLASAREREVTVEPPEARGIEREGRAIGATVDVGTTTVAAQLVDLRTGDVITSSGALNEQRVFGADVLSRVAYSAGGIDSRLHTMIAGQVDALLGEMLAHAEIDSADLVEAVAVGNVAMTGLLLGEDVSALGEAPYEGAPTGEAAVSGEAAGLAGFPSLRLLVPPAPSAFIGSDITAGMLAAALADRVTATLYVDLGTNGEIVLAARGNLLAASTAAGPALEGASIECGMRAEPGAIEQVELVDGALRFRVIGERRPAGICGSGLLDLVAALLDAGVLDASGRLVDSVGHPLRERLTEREGVRAFVVDSGADIVLTQRDIRQVQLALGAVRAGIEILLAEAPLEPSAVASVVIAGGFGYHVRTSSLVGVGLFPPAWLDRITFEGNAALTGARMMLLGTAAREKARTVAERVRTLDLAAHPGFQQRFLDALNFSA